MLLPTVASPSSSFLCAILVLLFFSSSLVLVSFSFSCVFSLNLFFMRLFVFLAAFSSSFLYPSASSFFFVLHLLFLLHLLVYHRRLYDCPPSTGRISLRWCLSGCLLRCFNVVTILCIGCLGLVYFSAALRPLAFLGHCSSVGLAAIRTSVTFGRHCFSRCCSSASLPFPYLAGAFQLSSRCSVTLFGRPCLFGIANAVCLRLRQSPFATSQSF